MNKEIVMSDAGWLCDWERSQDKDSSPMQVPFVLTGYTEKKPKEPLNKGVSKKTVRSRKQSSSSYQPTLF